MGIKSATLIYFSPTYATKRVLCSIAEGMRIESRQDIDLSLVDKKPFLIKTDIALLGVPVYGKRIPKHLYNFLNLIKAEGVPAVIIAVYGNVNAGFALDELFSIVRRNGFCVVARGSFIGRHSFSTMEVPLANDRPNFDDLKTAKEFGSKIERKMGDYECMGEECCIHQSLDGILVGNILNIFHSFLPQFSNRIFLKTPKVNVDICTRCLTCVKQCPRKAIDPETLRIDKNLCIGCLRCARICPSKAWNVEYKHGFLIRTFFRWKNAAQKHPSMDL